MTVDTSMPEVGAKYQDHAKRTLVVSSLHLADPSGREIRGVVSHRTQPDRDYSCTLEIWREIWRDKAPPIDPSKMKIG